jgi:hypothetical protein
MTGKKCVAEIDRKNLLCSPLHDSTHTETKLQINQQKNTFNQVCLEMNCTEIQETVYLLWWNEYELSMAYALLVTTVI